MAFAHMGQFAAWVDGSVALKDSATVDPRAVAGVRSAATVPGTRVSIKLHDKLEALVRLGEHLGLWQKAPEPQGDPLRVVIVEDA